MRLIITLTCILTILLNVSGCAGLVRSTVDDRREKIDRMEKETLQQLFTLKPEAREILERASGYAVFTNITGQYVFFGGGGGYGVAVYKEFPQRSYMKMAQVNAGLGVGLQDVSMVFVFHSTTALDSFVSNGWDFSGQINAVAASSEKGSSMGAEMSIFRDVDIYTFAQSGLLAKINLAGTRYWLDDLLND